jgi:hypothetical protein
MSAAIPSNTVQSGARDELFSDAILVDPNDPSEPGSPPSVQYSEAENEEVPEETPSAPIADATAAKSGLGSDTEMALRQRRSPDPAAAAVVDKTKPADKEKEIIVHQKKGCCDCLKRLWSKC